MSDWNEILESKKLTEERVADKPFFDRHKETRRLEKLAEDEAFNAPRQRRREHNEQVNAAFLESHKADIARQNELRAAKALQRKQQEERALEMAQEARERIATEIIH